MSAFEGSYKSLLQGVSQQVPRERLDGQVAAMDNMLCDAVTNTRRRPGLEYVYDMAWPGVSYDRVRSWNTDIGGYKVDVLLNTTTGEVAVRYESGSLSTIMPPNDYLKTDNRSDIQATTVGDQFVLCNTAVMPTAVADWSSVLNPARRGYFFIRSGAFSYTYQISLYNGSSLATFQYLTPKGDAAGDAAQATPAYIAGQLAAGLNASGYSAVADGAFVYVEHANPTVSVTTSSGSNYVVVSGTQYVTGVESLPSRLPTQGNGMIMAVGSRRTPTYYQFDHALTSWLECGQYGSATKLNGMPLALGWDGSAWAYDPTPYEGRLAGDDTSNPPPNFLTRGITGISAFQGRLVLLSGSLVNLSASRRIHRWFRSTIVDLLDSDPIEVGASANSSAAYVYAVPFQKDLLLFSSKYQALIPSGQAALTPRNASVVITSTHEADTSCAPLGLGRTLMFPKPRNTSYYGMMEMVPSPNTDSQYVSDDATAHLPQYFAGRCRFAVASSVANLVLVGSTTEPRVIYIHEYIWSGENKAQQAWHRWTFPFDIADAYFVGEQAYVLFAANGQLVACKLDPRGQGRTGGGAVRPFLDLYSELNVIDNRATIPDWLRRLDPHAAGKVKLSQATGGNAGEEVGCEFVASTDNFVTTGDSFPVGAVTMGYPFMSRVIPTSPMIKDANGVVISSNKLTVLRFMIGTAKSSQYEVAVTDSASPEYDEEQEMGTLYWSSPELQLGQARINGESTAIVPCRTNAATTILSIYTDGLGELNIISLEHTSRWNQKLRRR